MATLRDVARRAGVDLSTASRALSGDTRKPVRAETRERILTAATALQYRPNRIARSLRTRRTETIGVVVPDISNPAVASIFQGVQEIASATDFNVVVVDSRVSSGRSWEQLAVEGRVDGLLVLVANVKDAVVRRMARRGFPVVLVNRRTKGVTGSVVMKDDVAAERVVHLFAEHGHVRIGHVVGLLDHDTSRRRLAGFARGIATAGLEFDRGRIVEADYTESDGMASVRTLLSAPPRERVTAIYVTSFPCGIGALAATKVLGLRVPDDISIVVSDELSYAAYTDPPLSTVRMPTSQMGSRATEMLLGAIAGQPVDDLVVEDEPEIILRGSVGRLR